WRSARYFERSPWRSARPRTRAAAPQPQRSFEPGRPWPAGSAGREATFSTRCFAGQSPSKHLGRKSHGASPLGLASPPGARGLRPRWYWALCRGGKCPVPRKSVEAAIGGLVVVASVVVLPVEQLQDVLRQLVGQRQHRRAALRQDAQLG